MTLLHIGCVTWSLNTALVPVLGFGLTQLRGGLIVEGVVVVPPRELPDYLLSRGRSSVSLSEVAGLLGSSEKDAASAMVRLRRSGRIFSPSPGLYLPVPPQFRTWGSLPAMDFIDPMMRAGGLAYYVAYLSAAELHGAAHQRPQVFQVVVDRPVQDRDFGRVRVRFYRSKLVTEVPTVLRNSASGQVRVASPEVVALDLAARPDVGAGLSNVATVLGELAEDGKLDPAQIEKVAGLYPVSVSRRLGWLLDFVGSQVPTNGLLESVRARSRARRVDDLLLPGGPRRGKRSERWGIVVNSVVEPDL